MVSTGQEWYYNPSVIPGTLLWTIVVSTRINNADVIILFTDLPKYHEYDR